MALSGKFLAYFYAFALSLGTLCVPPGALYFPDPHQEDWSSSAEKIDTSKPFDFGYIINENNQVYSSSYNSSSDRDSLDFFYSGDSHYFFLNNKYNVAFTLSKIHEINFKFIDLIYPFHYFW